MFKIVAVALTAIGGCAGACDTVPLPGDTPVTACTGTVIDGVEVVTFMHDDVITCDVSPPQQLNLVWDNLGGDASLAAAEEGCLDAGGKPVFIDGRKLVCGDVDY